MVRVFAVAMAKGGTSKTTTSLNLGVGLARRGHRVLLVDLDPQASLTIGLGVNPTTLTATTYEAIIAAHDGRDASFAVMETAEDVDLLPASLNLAGAEAALTTVQGRETLLKTALVGIASRYDYVFIDTPPAVGFLTFSALAAAETVLVSLQAQVYALYALDQLEAEIAIVQSLNPTLAIGVVVVTMVDRRTNLGSVIEAQARERFGDRVCHTTVPISVRIAESPAAGQSIFTFAPGSPAAIAYGELAKEIEERYGT